MRPGKLIRVYALGLIVLTPGLLLWQHYGMNRVLRVDAGSPHRIQSVDDGTSQGGSRSTFSRQGGRLVLDSQIASGFAWPFAELDISLSEHSTGIDLSQYDELRIRVDYRAPGSRQLRVFLRSCDPAYSDPLEPNTWKLHEADFAPAPGGETKLIPLRNFTVTSWWITDHHIPVEQASPDLRRARIRLRQSRQREQELEGLTSLLQLENKTIGEMARRDPLTGARNRAGILDEILHEAQISHRTGLPLAILMADVDHFKEVNDTCGHDVGDQVLCRIAREMDALVRKTDYLVRWGDEEFALLCPATELTAAQALAEKIRQHLEAIPWPHQLRITLSLGVTTLGHEPIPDALKRADRALYAAKAQGRNAVVVLPPPSEGSEDSGALA